MSFWEGLMAQHVPAVLTQYTAEEVLSCLLTLWGEVFETKPEKKSLLVLLSHSRLETGVWKKMYSSYFCYRVRFI